MAEFMNAFKVSWLCPGDGELIREITYSKQVCPASNRRESGNFAFVSVQDFAYPPPTCALLP